MQESILFMVFFLAKDGALILGHHRIHWTGGQGLHEVLFRQWQIPLILIDYAQDHTGVKALGAICRKWFRSSTPPVELAEVQIAKA